MTPEEKQARAIKPRMDALSARIGEVKRSGYKHGGKINLDDCSVFNAREEFQT
jgi:hypothetical protein